MTRTTVVPAQLHTQSSLHRTLTRIASAGSRSFAAAHLAELLTWLPPDDDHFDRCDMPVGDRLCLLPGDHTAGCIAPPRGYQPEETS